MANMKKTEPYEINDSRIQKFSEPSAPLNTLEERIAEFRRRYPDWSIKTDVVQVGEVVVYTQSTVFNDKGTLVATALADVPDSGISAAERKSLSRVIPLAIAMNFGPVI